MTCFSFLFLSQQNISLLKIRYIKQDNKIESRILMSFTSQATTLLLNYLTIPSITFKSKIR